MKIKSFLILLSVLNASIAISQEQKDDEKDKLPEQTVHEVFLEKLNQQEALKELNSAIRNNNLERASEILRLFPETLEQKDKFGATPLYNAVHAGKIDAVKMLIGKNANIRTANKLGDTPLHRAAESGHYEILVLLLEKGSLFWEKNNKGETPVFKAVSGGKTKNVELLLEKGEIINRTDNLGNTPLHKAAAKGNITMLKYLIGKGADINAKNKQGKKPSDMAIDQKIKDYLLSIETDKASAQ